MSVQSKAVAEMHVGWLADRTRLALGQARPLLRHEDPETATLGETDRARFLPHFDGWCTLVIDVPPGAESPIYDSLTRECASGGHVNDDNLGQPLCKTCEDWSGDH